MLSGPVNSVTTAARTTPLLVSFTCQTKVVRHVASPVPSPSYVVPGGATDGQVVNLVDDAHHGLRNRRHRRRHLLPSADPLPQPADVETLLEPSADDGVAEAEAAIERLAVSPRFE